MADRPFTAAQEAHELAAQLDEISLRSRAPTPEGTERLTQIRARHKAAIAALRHEEQSRHEDPNPNNGIAPRA